MLNPVEFFFLSYKRSARKTLIPRFFFVRNRKLGKLGRINPSKEYWLIRVFSMSLTWGPSADRFCFMRPFVVIFFLACVCIQRIFVQVWKVKPEKAERRSESVGESIKNTANKKVISTPIKFYWEVSGATREQAIHPKKQSHVCFWMKYKKTSFNFYRLFPEIGYGTWFTFFFIN